MDPQTKLQDRWIYSISDSEDEDLIAVIKQLLINQIKDPSLFFEINELWEETLLSGIVNSTIIKRHNNISNTKFSTKSEVSPITYKNNENTFY
ncbi:hypothetical protein BI362_11160 [Streptococcus parauberis]|nr:hypothetical protein BI362_11160 [Streptococcus parauberis]